MLSTTADNKKPFYNYCVMLAFCLFLVACPYTLAADIDYPLIYTRTPLDAAQWFGDSRAEGMMASDFYEGSQLVLRNLKGEFRVITTGFHSACDPDVSFDGKRILFSGKKKQSDNWNVFEADLAGGTVRQITRDFGNCRHPRYMSTFYTIVAPGPWYTLAFLSDHSRELTEFGGARSTDIYSCKLDGSGIQRLTYNPSTDFDPLMMPDGRILYSTWQRNLPEQGRRGRIDFFTINTDGTDISLFNRQGKNIKQMATITPTRLVVFVESDSLPWDGAGSLGTIRLNRFIKGYRALEVEAGLYHSPSPLPNGQLLVSRRPADGSGNHDVFLLDLEKEEVTPLVTDPRFHLLQAVAVAERKIPDGRSSVVNEKDPNGQLFCLDITNSDSEEFSSNILALARKARFIEGVPATASTGTGKPDYLNKRILGEVAIKADGSLFVEVPANIPVKVQLIDENGMSLREGTWIWVRNHEPRGCIGCHEDPELVPENRMVDAVTRPPSRLTLSPSKRRSVSFSDSLVPVVEKHCSTAACHGEGSNHVIYLPATNGDTDRTRKLYETLTEGTSDASQMPGEYVHPGRARTSPLIWHLMGKNTSQKWDNVPDTKKMSPMGPSLSPEELRMFVEWIDLGAHWELPVSDQSDQASQDAGR